MSQTTSKKLASSTASQAETNPGAISAESETAHADIQENSSDNHPDQGGSVLEDVGGVLGSLIEIVTAYIEE